MENIENVSIESPRQYDDPVLILYRKDQSSMHEHSHKDAENLIDSDSDDDSFHSIPPCMTTMYFDNEDEEIFVNSSTSPVTDFDPNEVNNDTYSVIINEESAETHDNSANQNLTGAKSNPLHESIENSEGKVASDKPFQMEDLEIINDQFIEHKQECEEDGHEIYSSLYGSLSSSSPIEEQSKPIMNYSSKSNDKNRSNSAPMTQSINTSSYKVDNDVNSLSSPWKLISPKPKSEENHNYNQINSLSFNQNKDCIAIGTDYGIYIRNINASTEQHQSQQQNHQNGTRVKRIISHKLNEDGATLCEMLYSTSLIAVVKPSNPRTLSLMNNTFRIIRQNKSKKDVSLLANDCQEDEPTSTTKTKNSTTNNETRMNVLSLLCNINMSAAVRRVEINLQRIFILTADAKLHIFDSGTVRLLKSLSVLHESEPLRLLLNENATTTGAFFDITKAKIATRKDDNHSTNSSSSCSWLVTRCSEDVGMICVYDSISKDLRLVTKAKAHENSIARIAIGGKGKDQKLAVACEKGTVIHVFGLPHCEKLHTLWRGSSKCNVYSIAFDPFATRVAVSASTGTIHLYKIECDEYNQMMGTCEQSFESNLSKASPTKILASAMKASTRWSQSINSINPIHLFPNHGKVSSQIILSFAKIKLKSNSNTYNKLMRNKKNRIYPNILAFTPGKDGEEGCIYMLVATMEGTLHQYRIDRRSDAVRLMDMDDLILDAEDMEDCAKGIILNK